MYMLYMAFQFTYWICEMDVWWIFYGLKVWTTDSPPSQKFTFPIVIPTIGIRAKFSEREDLQPWGKILEMEVYKLGKVIENHKIEIQLILHQLNEAREDLKKSLRRRK